MIDHPFPPLYNEESRVLILGSFPSVKSREQAFFYGHPQNRFWKVLGGVFGQEAPATVEEKRAAIRAVVRKVIWDGINAHVVLFGAQDGEPELPELTDRLAPPKASAAQAEEFLDETGETESPTAPMWPWCEDSK